MAGVAALAGVYFIAGKLGLKLAFVNASATAVWPPAGIALAAFLIFGYRVWLGNLLGAFLVNLTTAGSAATSIGVAVGNTLEGLIGSYLVRRFAGGRNAFDRAPNVFRFSVLAAILSTTVSATCGVTSLSLGGFADWAKYGPIWLTWWLGDAAGVLVVAPLVVLWSANRRFRWNRAHFFEAAASLLCLFLVGQIVFGGSFPSQTKNYPLEFLCTPFLIWVAFRFSQREAATAIFMLSVIAIRGTLHGCGPFVRETQNESLLLLQAFTGVTAVMTIGLAAVVSERKQAEEQMRQLAVTDPVTGLANYRRFMEALDAEIRRSQRTGRPFAVLLLDLDALKKINDRHGHPVGTRALCRLADVLRMHSRAIDTAARYGGDEFGLILVDTGERSAREVAHRISGQVAADREQPALSVSVGFALYGRDGETAEMLTEAADRALYEAKGRRGGKLRVPLQGVLR